MTARRRRTRVRTGQRFNRSLVLARVSPDPKHRNPRALCVCACGTVRIVREQYLTTGRSRSCGCLQAMEAREHIARLNRTCRANRTRGHNMPRTAVDPEPNVFDGNE